MFTHRKLQVHITSSPGFLLHTWSCQILFSGDLIDMRVKYGLRPRYEMCVLYVCFSTSFMLLVNEISHHDFLKAALCNPPLHHHSLCCAFFTVTHSCLCTHMFLSAKRGKTAGKEKKRGPLLPLCCKAFQQLLHRGTFSLAFKSLLMFI